MSVERRQRKNGVSWYVRLRRPDGSSYSRSFRTRKDAERFERAELALRDSGGWTDPTSGDILVSAWAEEWLASGQMAWRAATVDRHELALRTVWVPRLGSRRLNAVGPRDIQLVVNALVESHSSWTVRGYTVTGRKMFGDAVASEVLSRSPFRGIKASARQGQRQAGPVTG